MLAKMRQSAAAAMAALAVVMSGAYATAQDVEPQREVVKKVKPSYPDIARSLRLSGTVKLVAVVTAHGKVKSIEVTGGNPVLAAASEDAVKKWTFVAGPKETRESLAFRFDGPPQ